jgi:hypothetical protein
MDPSGAWPIHWQEGKGTGFTELRLSGCQMLATMRFQLGSCQPFLLGQRPKSNFFRLGTLLQAINLAVK